MCIEIKYSIINSISIRVLLNINKNYILKFIYENYYVRVDLDYF